MQDSSTSPTEKDPASRTRGCSGCFVWVFALMFLTFGVGAFYFMAVAPAWGMFRSQDWRATPCEIVSSELKVNDETNRIEVLFKYTFDNKDFQSNQFCFCQINSNTSNHWKQTVIANHPAGRQTVCYVNPDDPREAVIERGWVPDMWWGLFSLPFLAVGIGALLVAIGVIQLPNAGVPKGPRSWIPRLAANSAGDSADQTNESEPSFFSKSYSSLSSDEADGPVTLKASSSPLVMLFGIIVIALIWNGIVSVFVWQQVAQFQRGGMGAGDLMMCLFLSPFVLIGLLLIGAVFYFLLALLNPKPSLTVNSVAIPLGAKLKLNWTLSGSAGSIRKFRIALKGREKATYVRGTTTTTDESVFADITIFEATDTFDMEQGTREITIPHETMHSFEASNNKVVWVLEVKGDIPFWPDISSTFPITVLPHSVNSSGVR